MKSIIAVSSLFLLAASLWGQVYYSNNVTRVEAIRAASRLRAGMWQEDVEKQLSTNGLSGGIGTGAQAGWNWCYGLSDGSCLVLDYRMRALSTKGLWGQYGILQNACITSNSVTIAQIALPKGP